MTNGSKLDTIALKKDEFVLFPLQSLRGFINPNNGWDYKRMNNDYMISVLSSFCQG